MAQLMNDNGVDEFGGLSDSRNEKFRLFFPEQLPQRFRAEVI